MGTNESGEANFLGGVASVKGVKNFNPEAAKKRFFEIYLDKVIESYKLIFYMEHMMVGKLFDMSCCLVFNLMLSLNHKNLCSCSTQNQKLELDSQVPMN